MCLAIEQMRQESEEIGIAKGIAEGIAKGIAEGKLVTLFELVKAGLLTVAQAASNAKLTEEQFKAEMQKAGF